MSKVLKDIYFEDMSGFVDYIMDKLYDIDDCYTITIVGKYREIHDAIKAIVPYDVKLIHINFSVEEFSEYTDEYYLTIDVADGEFEVYCCPARDDGVCLTDSANESYIFGTCGSQIIKHCDAEDKYLVIVEENEEGDFDAIEEDDIWDEETTENDGSNNIKDCGLTLFRNKKDDISGFKFHTKYGDIAESCEFHSNRKMDTDEISKMIRKMFY